MSTMIEIFDFLEIEYVENESKLNAAMKELFEQQGPSILEIITDARLS